MTDIVDGQSSGFWAIAIRGAIMVIAGLVALFAPIQALATLVMIGGALMIIDGALGLWGLLFGGKRTQSFWASVTRQLLAVIAGLLVVSFPVVATSIGVSTMVIIVGIISILVGALEIYVAYISRKIIREGTYWPSVLSGLAYVAFGILIMVMPLTMASIVIRLVGLLVLLYGLFQLFLAWQLRRV
ncbi:hypothetical protein JP74_11285 [Devosia sp. 17-2-E-8]|uniref:DUF308 domain-containing protein n=1 Tax=Paradevosia shaoguanensis TaxID=1335043 RepID=UPI000455BC03|nr:DUF308 domain-containing protein [Paradevosia shaoguanensis]KFL26676.1 hypothetical protein JP74_11285 [Devosia sp. 17-2-E-8]CDP50943.1 putative membrane protein [Devosia sp. DBB001]